MNVSVAMCTYNGGRYLQRQLDSLAAQSCLPHELVLCDDGSSDTTVELIHQFTRRAPFPVRFFQNEKNLGSTKNFEQAISSCRGELIALCDQDDVWRPEKIEKQVSVFEKEPLTGGVFCDGDLIDAASQPMHRSLWGSVVFTPAMRRLVSSGRPSEVLARQNFVTGATLVFKAEMRPYFMPIPHEWVHDAWIAWLICLHSQLSMLPDRLIHYRIHKDQQIGASLRPIREGLKRNPVETVFQHEQELLRMGILLEKINGSGVRAAAGYSRLVQRKIAFQRARIDLLHKSPGLRVAALAFELRGYMEFAKGPRSMAGDLLL